MMDKKRINLIYRLEILPTNETEPIVFEQIERQGLEVEFRIKKTRNIGLNTGFFRITNPSLDSIQRIQKPWTPKREKGYALSFYTAFAGLGSLGKSKEELARNFNLLYQGEITMAVPSREGMDVVLDISCSTGSFFAKEYRAFDSGKEGESLGDFLTDFAFGLGFTKKDGEDFIKFLGKAKEIVQKKILNGKSIFGSLLEIFGDLSRDLGVQFDLQGDQIVCSVPGEPYSQNAIKIGPGNFGGMINTPLPTPKGIDLQTLLRPEILPGQLLEVDSDFLSKKHYGNRFVAEVIEYVGNSFNGDALNKIEAYKEEKK